MTDCRNCVTCQNCFSCQGSCYTCERGYGGEAQSKDLDMKENQSIEKKEVVQFENIWYAIYDALDRIAYQLEIVNRFKEEELRVLRRIVDGSCCTVRRGNVGVGDRNRVQERGTVKVRRRALANVDEELRFVPDTVGKVRIRKQLKLD